MPVTSRSPRPWIAVAVAALLFAVIAFNGPGRAGAQDANATPTAEAGPTKTPTAAQTPTATETPAATDAAGESVTAADTGDTVFAVGDSLVVADGPLNLRDAAGTDAQVVSELALGTRLTVTDGPQTAGDYAWYEVQTAAAETGWVAGAFLASGDAAIFAAGDEVDVADGPLNVRDDSSINGAVLSQLATGDTATIVSGPIAADDYAWYEVQLDADTTGWVAGEFLAVAGSASDGSGATATSGSDGQFAVDDAVRVAVADTNFRAAAGLDAEVLDTLDLDALFVVQEGPVSQDGYTWYRVFNYFYGEGWVAGEMLTRDASGFPS